MWLLCSARTFSSLCDPETHSRSADGVSPYSASLLQTWTPQPKPTTSDIPSSSSKGQSYPVSPAYPAWGLRFLWDNKPRVFTPLNGFVWPNCTKCAWSRIGGKFTGRKYVSIRVCPWLDLVGNPTAFWVYLYKPLQNVTCHCFLGTLEWSWLEFK